MPRLNTRLADCIGELARTSTSSARRTELRSPLAQVDSLLSDDETRAMLLRAVERGVGLPLAQPPRGRSVFAIR